MNKSFYTSLAAELNNRTKDIEPEWEVLSHGVSYDWNNVNDDGFLTYVEVSFGNDPVGDWLKKYTVTISVNGERDDVYQGTDRNTAIAFAIAKAIQIEKEWVPVDVEDGFEHEGTWITDRTKSPCGRFELTPEESEKLYGKENG